MKIVVAGEPGSVGPSGTPFVRAAGRKADGR